MTFGNGPDVMAQAGGGRKKISRRIMVLSYQLRSSHGNFRGVELLRATRVGASVRRFSQAIMNKVIKKIASSGI